MENNPIDKLFAEKLRQVEKTPRADVWSQIQVRQQEKKRGAFWWTTIAASVLLLLSGGLSWQYFSSERGSAAHQEIATQTTEPKVIQIPETTYTAAKQSEKKGTGIEEKVVEEKIVSKPKVRFKARTKQTPKLESAPQPELIAVNLETSPGITQPGISSEEAEAPVAPVTKPAVLVMTIAETSVATEEPQPKSNATTKINGSKINVTVEKGVPVAAEGKKKTRAGKILQQLKHIKNGEKVEWKEIGIHPENLLALVKPDRSNKNNSSK